MLVVFDIDGTLANIEHRIHHVRTKPKNWKKFREEIKNDKPYPEMRNLLMKLRAADCTILYCTGRSNEERQETTQWLSDHIYDFDLLQDHSRLYMRPDKDYRQDDIIKVELLQEIVKDHGVPDLWFDDRSRVVDAIRGQGIRVLQVAPGDF